MAIFPELIPSTRTYSPGAFPHTRHGVYNGSEVRVRHSNTMLGVRLRLFFPALTTADLLTVIAHYNGQRGRFLPFAIPDELLSGTTAPADFTPAGHQWRYAVKPAVEDISVDSTTPSNLHNLIVELETVPPENTIAQGARLRVRASLQAGSPQLGIWLDAIASLAAGAATGGLSLLLNASASLSAGLASTGTTFVDPLTAVATLTAGAANSIFDPVSLSPTAWWDASDATTITLSSGAIADWDDKSGNGWTVSQATSTKRPTIATAAINGLDAALWPTANNDDFLRSAAGSFTIREFYAVIKFANATFNNYEGLFGPADNSAQGWFTGSENVSGVFFNHPVYINGNNSTDRQSDLAPEFQSTCLVRWVAASAITTTAGVTLGMDRLYDNLDRGWNGHICEVVVFPDLLATGDRGDLETYLMDKWDV